MYVGFIGYKSESVEPEIGKGSTLSNRPSAVSVLRPAIP